MLFFSIAFKRGARKSFGDGRFAANALLKTLEEPPPHAVLLLIAQGAGDLLPTIVSRCRVLKLRPVRREVVAAALQAEHGMAHEDAALLAALSGGRVGWALRMLEQPELLQQHQEQLDTLIALPSRSLVERLKWAEDRAKEYRGDAAGVNGWLQVWQSWWRDVLLSASNTGAAITHRNRRDALATVGRSVSHQDALGFLRRLDLARQQLAENVNPQLALEHLVLHLP